MKKLGSQTPELMEANIDKIAVLFPQVVTEKEAEDGTLTRSVDLDLLRQELSGSVVEGGDERYRLDWPGKRASLLKANTPIKKTLRPVRDESVDFDTTQNLFIEGDNFEALKILQESYLGKVKMIYIDPPYNTGKDFVYKDNFTKNKADYEEEIGAVDEEGNKMFRENTRTNPRFHSDWLSMMYERLIIARDLLSEDGVIFISIDDNEQAQLRLVCDEIIGQANFRNMILIRRRVKSLNNQFAEKGLKTFNVGAEYILVYSKSENFLFNALRRKNEEIREGYWGGFWSGADRPTMRYEILGFIPRTGQWRWSKQLADEAIKNYKIWESEFSHIPFEKYAEDNDHLRFIKRDKNGNGENGGVQYWIKASDSTMRTSAWLDIEVSQIQKAFDLPFDNPKNVLLIEEIIKSSTDGNAVILDFFSGSATTAHAVMAQNAEDGGSRKFIMVQLPEETPEDSEARKAGYDNIAQLGRERIRLSAEKIKTEFADKLSERNTPLDTGFRTYRVDDTAFLDVERQPAHLGQGELLALANNLRSDRTPEDLLTQVMLELGLTLDLPIEEKEISGHKIFFVAQNALVACLDGKVPLTLIDELVKCSPLQVVFRDSSFGSDQDRINAETHIKRLSPDTELLVL